MPHIIIRNNKIRELKTSVSARSIPVVARLKKPLLERCANLSAKDPVFSDNNRATNNISAKLNKVIRAAGVPRSPKLVAYSFRHTMKEALRAAGVPVEDQWDILGHSNPTVASRYGSPIRDLKKVKRQLDKAVKELGNVPEGTHDSVS